jgi:hypothetical protein
MRFPPFPHRRQTGFVPHRWASLGDAVRWIRRCAGHGRDCPSCPIWFKPNEEYALFSEFKQHGGLGVEVVTGSHRPEEYPVYAALAREFGLAASRGSDFHSPDESRTDLGALATLPTGLTPVWELLASRIQRAA